MLFMRSYTLEDANASLMQFLGTCAPDTATKLNTMISNPGNFSPLSYSKFAFLNLTISMSADLDIWNLHDLLLYKSDFGALYNQPIPGFPQANLFWFFIGEIYTKENYNIFFAPSAQTSPATVPPDPPVAPIYQQYDTTYHDGITNGPVGVCSHIRDPLGVGGTIILNGWLRYAQIIPI